MDNSRLFRWLLFFYKSRLIYKHMFVIILNMQTFHYTTCLNCKRSFSAPARELKRGSAKFCSRSCSASFGNKLRRKQAVPNLKCDNCGKDFYRKPSLVKSVRKYCSEDCFREATGRAFSREKVLDAIKGFVCEYGRRPIQVDFTTKKGWLSPSTVAEHFGTWNQAIKEAGFSPNSASIGYICRAKDGHLCRSH
ncbi:hypothetical protein [Candidatus Aquicultor secundus]|uniref:homing endonuclease associated repeat-containing protein n=2 Tax=Candidatus Aquicultor secundus TaxID=1973895 RepID=UPI00338D443A